QNITHISPLGISQHLSKMVKIVNAKKMINGFEDVFVVQKKFTYVDNDNLALLTKKTQ
ncbi:2959_t:CDS:1, partial [Racocetra persica]